MSVTMSGHRRQTLSQKTRLHSTSRHASTVVRPTGESALRAWKCAWDDKSSTRLRDIKVELKEMQLMNIKQEKLIKWNISKMKSIKNQH